MIAADSMDARVGEIERWRREQIDPAIKRLQEDDKDIRRTLAEMAAKTEAVGRDARAAHTWSMVAAIGAIGFGVATIAVALHG